MYIRGVPMQVYVVIENGEPYPHVYASFALAVAKVKEKHAETVAEQEESDSLCSDLDAPEQSDRTYLYVEKGIHIYIYKRTILLAGSLL